MPASRPFTYTRVAQVTAPKLSSTRRPRQPAGTVNVRRYQPAVSPRSIPDSGDWTGNGTRIVCARFRPNGGRCPRRPRSYCHWPFRFSHAERSSCGRGYLRRGRTDETPRVHGVVSGGSFRTYGAVAHALGAALATRPSNAAIAASPPATRTPPPLT